MGDTEAAAEPKARGRGRPKKADAKEAVNDVESVAGEAAPARGRGRPGRKAAEAATTAMKDQAAGGTKREHDGDDDAPKSKRGRGRPKGTGKKRGPKPKATPKKSGRPKAGAKKAKAAASESEEGAGDTGGESGGD